MEKKEIRGSGKSSARTRQWSLLCFITVQGQVMECGVIPPGYAVGRQNQNTVRSRELYQFYGL